jgi:hypothetical protein
MQSIRLFVIGVLIIVAQTGKKDVVFSRDVAPIFHKNCVACHRPDDIAPMSLVTYKDARAWAKSIRERVVSRQMPPWRADPRHGEFANDTRLSQQEVACIEPRGAKRWNEFQQQRS